MELQSSGNEIFDIYNRQQMKKDQHLNEEEHKDSVFLSSLSPLPYHEAEEKYTKTLTQFAKKQFPPVNTHSSILCIH